MLHVDEGALHAYLDGALDEYPSAEAARVREHLDGCSECADRLAAERAIRSDAAAMLGLAAPDVEMPSLEELRAYVKATRPARPPASIRMYRMGWAASVVLALGAGWIVRDGQLQPTRGENVRLFEDAATQPARQGVGQREAQTAGAEFEVDGRSTVAERAGGAGSTASPTAAGSSSARADLPADVTAKAPPVNEEIASSMKSESGSVDEDAVRPADVPEVMAALSDAEAPMGRTLDILEPITVDALRGGSDASTTAPETAETYAVRATLEAERFGDTLTPRLTSLDAAGAPAAVPGAPKPDVNQPAERRRAESLVPVTSAISQEPGFANRAADEADRKSADDEPSLVVPGYEVLSVTNLGDGTNPVGVHVVQRLEADETLELFHLQPGVDPSIVSPPQDGRNEIREGVGESWIVIQGRLTETELRTLFRKLFPEG